MAQQPTNAEAENSAVDLSGYKTPAGAAKRLHKYLSEEWDAEDGGGLYLWDPETTSEKRNHTAPGVWTVGWEGGPFEWGTWLLGGASMLAGTEFCSGYGTPEVVGFDGDGWGADLHYSFEVHFYPEGR